MVSCDDGGYPTQAISYVSRTGGVTYDSDYPYNSTSKKCDKTKTNYAVSVTTWNFVIGLQKMIDHVLNRNTLAVLLDSKNMQAYESGIFPVSNCVAEQANHAAQIVGVNVEGGYWIVRNTWGTGWGEKGYMRLELVRSRYFTEYFTLILIRCCKAYFVLLRDTHLSNIQIYLHHM